jgi:Putative peptidoglycan binding domain
MPRVLNKPKSNFYARFARVGRFNYILVGAFILTFVAAGTLYVHRSRASGACLVYKLTEYRFWGSQCVKDVQYALIKLGYPRYAGKVDGDFGPLTYAAVMRFGYANGYYNGGQVGARTWSSLCAAGWEYPSVANNMGCNSGIPYSQWGTQ